MKMCLTLLLAGLLLIGVGCTIQFESPPDYSDYPSDNYPYDYSPPVPAEEYPPPVPSAEYPVVKKNSNFDARIEAARSISNFSTRDGALSAIAIDAANELDIEHTIKALSMITNFSTKDTAAEKCVTPFINENMVEDARNIANRISNFSTRDRVLARIAQGPVQNN